METETLNIIVAMIRNAIYISYDPNPHPSIDKIRSLIISDPGFQAFIGRLISRESQDWFISILEEKIQEWKRQDMISGKIIVTKY